MALVSLALKSANPGSAPQVSLGGNRDTAASNGEAIANEQPIASARRLIERKNDLIGTH